MAHRFFKLAGPTAGRLLKRTLPVAALVFGAAAASGNVDRPGREDLADYARFMLPDSLDPSALDALLARIDPGDYPAAQRQLRDWVAQQQNFEARVRRGPYGVAHISAKDYASLGYGEGFAAAEDHVCNIAFGLLQARAESARFLGPGDSNQHLALDVVLRGLDIQSQARAALAAQSLEMQEWLAGYASGYNRYVREHPDGRNNSWCSGEPWVRAASPLDFMARMVLIAQTLPVMTASIASVAPPGIPAAAALQSSGEQQLAALDAAALEGMGSNGWALGSDLTANGRGALLANPHYPWYGQRRFWEKHLTIPGRLDIYGAQLLGSPGVSIGFNRHLGWTHTVSASQRLVFYRLSLDPDNPMRYRYGDEYRDISPREVSVAVADGEGGVQTHRQTLYFSHFGPLLSMPGMGWDRKFAYTVRDANVGNYSLLAQWKAMGEAQDMEAFIAAHRKYNALPWVNTIAATAEGRALYLDNSTVGYLPAAAEARWKASLESDPLAAQLYATRRMVLLDGSDPGNAWIDSGDAPIAGTTPFARRPRIERSDYVFNSNDSYWLSSPRQPLSGYSVLYGPTGSARTLRTRMNIRLLENHYGDAGEDGKFTLHEIQDALFANRGLSWELLGPELIRACDSAGDLGEACDVLRAYDGTLNLDSPGAALFREWITRYQPLDTLSKGALFARDFDVEKPVETPAGLGDTEAATDALRAAIAVLESAELALSASLRETQFAWRAGEAIPVHGGNSFEGVANLQMAGDPSESPIAGVSPEPIGDSRYLTDAGYPVVHGTSFVFTLAFEEKGPVAEALLSYSQSGNPSARHFRDQTDLYAQKQWRRVAFEEADVAADTRSVRVLRSP